MLDVTFAPPALPESGALVLLAGEGESPSGLWQEADAATGGAIGRALGVAEFKGSKGQSCTILAPGAGLSRVVVVGLGKTGELTPLLAAEAGGAAVTAVAKDGKAALWTGKLTPALAAAAAEGAVLRSYRFDRYRTKEKSEDKPRLERITVLAEQSGAAREVFAPARAVAEGVNFARDLVSEPPNVLTPAELAERCRKLGELGVTVEVLGPEEMRGLGFRALLGVAQGSVNEPRTVMMRWQGGSGGKPVAFIGKGVTFDTGGISLKPAANMEDMKWDMAGAGAVIGLMAALAGRRAKVDAIGIVGLVENMPSGAAQRPGDVVKTYSGQTVEIINTDAEGRLVLCDLLWYCQENYEPRFMVNLATLTGAIIVGLGHEYAGMFSNNDELAERLSAAGVASGEKLWRMPLAEAYDQLLKSDIADMKNVGGRPAGSVTAAQFLQRFVNGRPWAHLDIAGTAWATKDLPLAPKGATGFGVRLLDRLVSAHYEG
jgi:leucyl aminopeptidase